MFRGRKAADFERLMKDFDAYPRIYSPEMLLTHVLSHDGDHYEVTMRVRQKHIVTAVLDIDLRHYVRFRRGQFRRDRSAEGIQHFAQHAHRGD